MKKRISLFCLFLSIIAFPQNNTERKDDIKKQINEARIIGGEHPEKALEMLKKSNQDSKNINYEQGMLDSSNSIMILYYWRGDYKKVIEISNKAEKTAIELNHYELLADTYRLRGVSYIEMGFNNIGLKELKKALIASHKMKKGNSQYLQNAYIYDNMAQQYEKSSLDSTIFYKKKSLNEAEKVDNSPKAINQKYQVIAFQYMNLGVHYSKQNKKTEAEKYLLKSLEIYESGKYPLLPKNEKATLYSELGKFYFAVKDYKTAIKYAEEARYLEKSSPSPYIRKDIYEVLFKSYIEIENPSLSKKYAELYTALSDSIQKVGKDNIDPSINKIISKQTSEYHHNIQNILFYVGIFLIIAILLGWYFWRKSQRKLKTKYDLIIENLKNKTTLNQDPIPPVSISTSEKNPGIYITASTTNIILAKLDKFEKSHKFIRKDISVTALANEFQTNNRYLSEIIKLHKGGNFNNYINRLRIDYILNKLYEDPQFRKYKITYLADYCGFASREVFAAVFKKETGVTPSYFISNLKK